MPVLWSLRILTSVLISWTGLLAFASYSRAQVTKAPPFLLVVYASGGWDQTIAFDSKSDSPLVDGPPSGPQGPTCGGSLKGLNDWFGAYGDRAVIVNGLYTGAMESGQGYANIMTVTPTGQSQPVDFATYYGATLGPMMVLPHVVFDAPFYPGHLINQGMRLTEKRIDEYCEEAPPLTSAIPEDQKNALLAYQKKRWAIAASSVHPASLDGAKMRAFYSNLLREEMIRETLKETSACKKVPGQSNFLRSGKLAMELFASGASMAVTLQATRQARFWDSSAPYLRSGGINCDHFSHQKALFHQMFDELSQIMKYAASLGILDRLTVVIASDHGRAPRLNKKGGKDPWPYTSAVIYGSWTRGGTVQGKTDAILRGLPIDLVFGESTSPTNTVPTLANIFGTIYVMSGVPYRQILGDTKPMLSLVGYGATQ